MSLPRPWDPDKDDHLTMLYDMPLDDMPLDDMPVSPLSPWTVSTAPCPVSTSSTPLFGDFEVSYLLSITNEETAEDSDNEEDKSNDPEDSCNSEDSAEDSTDSDNEDVSNPLGLGHAFSTDIYPKRERFK